jgi:hypothetical protein
MGRGVKLARKHGGRQPSLHGLCVGPLVSGNFLLLVVRSFVFGTNVFQFNQRSPDIRRWGTFCANTMVTLCCAESWHYPAYIG